VAVFDQRLPLKKEIWFDLVCSAVICIDGTRPSGDIKNPAKPGESRLNPAKKPGLRRLLIGFGQPGDEAAEHARTPARENNFQVGLTRICFNWV